MKTRTGVLLVNLGTPDSAQPKDVFRYLNEFLTDGRVLDFSWLKRQLLARGLIVPFRYKQSAEQYRQLWTSEGSPLLVHGLALKGKVQTSLGDDFKVVLAMRYQNPSIVKGLEDLKREGVDEIIIFPLFPQYASATTGSIHQKVMDHVKKWQVIPKLTFVNSFYDHPAFIEAFCQRGSQYPIESYDHVLFSFHGLPERHLRKADPVSDCLNKSCCDTINKNNQFCYKAQCHATARAIADKLKIPKSKFKICFQSRLGKDPWIQPYTSDEVKTCAKMGHKKVLVFCPAFVCDCLETTFEIGHEYGKEFKDAGGEELRLVEGLNSESSWVEALKTMILENRCM